MQKKKLFIIFVIATAICLISVSAQCGIQTEAPTIKLEIYDGPDYSESDNMCYYRVEAIVSGDPKPEVEFEADDNVKSLGSDKVEVGVDIGDSYTLEVTATNLAGTATNSTVLLGECGEEVAGEEAPPEEEVAEEETAAEEEEITEGAEEEEEGVAPTIALEIYEGPTYSAADDVCYYRVKATVTGSPSPAVGWSKDDSESRWGTKKAQVNLTRADPTYTLIATATNSEGTDTASIELNWGCGELVEEHTMDLHPSDIGCVDSSGLVNSTAIAMGDTSINTDACGFFAFNVSGLSGKEIVSATLKLEDPFYTPNPCNFKGDIQIYFVDFLPGGLTALDYLDIPYYGPVSFDWDEDPLEYSSGYLKDTVLDRVETARKIQFGITYQIRATGGLLGVNEGRVYEVDDIILSVVYTD